MAKRLVLWGILALALGTGITFALPATRYPVLGYLRDEPLYDGRPTTFWVAALKDDEPKERRQAALMLGEVGAGKESPTAETKRPLVIAALVAALGDSDGFVRKCAATSLLMYPKETTVAGDRSNIECLLGALRDDEVVVRRAAARGLWQAGAAAKEAQGVTALTESLSDQDDFVRAYAARALARIGPDAEAAVPRLLQSLRNDEDRDVRKLAAKTLGLIGPKAIGPLLPDVVEALSAALKGDPPGLREYAARSLGQLGGVQAVPALRQAVQDRDDRVRASAVEALKLLESR
jgi:HEAT repeat protein